MGFAKLAAVAALAFASVSVPTLVLAETPTDQLIVGFSMANVLTLDPAGSGGKERVQILTNVYDGLVSLDAVNRTQVNPALAESWEVNEAGDVITFKLRPNISFASGNPVTAQDVIWSLKRTLTLNLAQASNLKTRGFTVDNADASFTAPDDQTVVITLPVPQDPQIVIMTLAMDGPGTVLDSKLVLENEVDGDLGAAWLTNNTAGSGPFSVDQLRSNELVLLTRNDNYWGEASALRRIVMRHVPESQTQRLQLERGDLDIAYSLAAADLAALTNNQDVVVETNGGSGMYYLAVSMKDERFADPDVRLAIRNLIDFEGINSAIMPYYGIMHERPIHAGFLGELPNPDYALDVDAAKALLTEAGYADGMNVTIRALSEAPFLNIATAIQGTLAQGGINAEIITGSGEQIYGAMRERNFELIVGRSGGQVPHPDADLRGFAFNPDNSDEARLTGLQAWRASFYDADLNAMIDAALLEADPEAQRQMYEDIQTYYEEIVPAIQPISQVSDSVAYRADISGLVIHPSWQTELSQIVKNR